MRGNREMRKYLRFVLPAVIAVALLPVLQACSGGNDNSGSGGKAKIVWSVWGNPGEHKRLQEFTDEFNKRHKDIEAEMVPIPGSYTEKITTMLTGKTAPDVFYVGDTLLPNLIENGLIENLSPYLSGSSLNPDDLYQSLMTPTMKDGEVYAIPPDMNPNVLWYNKKVLREAGITESPADLYEQGQWTWDKFTEMTQKIHAGGKHGYILDTGWGWNYSWVTANGGKFYSGDTYVGAADSKSVEAYKYLYDNVQNKNFTFGGTLPSGQTSDAQFMSNLAGFIAAGRYLLPNFKMREDLEYDIVPFPTNTGNKIEPATIGSAFVVMNSASKHKQAAWTFIEEFNNKEGQLFRLKDGGNAVPTLAGLESVVEGDNLPEHARYFLEAGAIGYVYPDFLYPAVTNEVVTQFDRLMLLKDISFDDAMKEADANANKKLQELKAQ